MNEENKLAEVAEAVEVSEEGPAYIGALFDELADDYDEMHREVGWDPWPHVRAALGNGALDGKRIVDVGCGTGILTRAGAGKKSRAGSGQNYQCRYRWPVSCRLPIRIYKDLKIRKIRTI